jgi:uncharacterized protein involved in outer membrane biogenesis
MAIRHRTRLILIVIAALSVVVVLLAPLLLNLDRYRPRVISYLQARTGKPVEIGHLSLTFYPHVAIRIDDFGMKNPAEFPSDYFVKVGRIDAKLDARALLHRQIVIKLLVLQDPLINLVSDPDGPWNFENPGSQESWQSFPLGVIGRIEIRLTPTQPPVPTVEQPSCAAKLAEGRRCSRPSPWSLQIKEGITSLNLPPP